LYYQTRLPDYGFFYSYALTEKKESGDHAVMLNNISCLTKGLMLKSNQLLRLAILISNDTVFIERVRAYGLHCRRKYLALYSTPDRDAHKDLSDLEKKGK